MVGVQRLARGLLDLRQTSSLQPSQSAMSPDPPLGLPPVSLYLRGWCREGWWRGSDEGLEDDEGEQGDMDARDALAAASSASSSSPPPLPCSSWLTLDCKAAGVSHSLGRQLCRKGTHELK